MDNLKVLKTIIDKNESSRQKRFMEIIKLLDKFVLEKDNLFLEWHNKKPYLIRGSFAHGLDSDLTTNIDVWILLKKVSKPEDDEHNLFIFNWFENVIREYFWKYNVKTYKNKSSIDVEIENNFNISFVPFLLDRKQVISRMYKNDNGHLSLINETDIKEEPEFNSRIKKIANKSSINNLKLFIIASKIIISSRIENISGDIIENFILSKYEVMEKTERSVSVKIFLEKIANGEFNDFVKENYSTRKISLYANDGLTSLENLAKKMLSSIEENKNNKSYIDVLVNYLNMSIQKK
ncbi:hypothetical protein [Spiroplasma tabanidicola]|uniref:Nucleotidyltransferase n=1 Tax=Spiroplasma tabanidicola TaxID=324079 RepID=A0A6I6CB03_9MOLU|nr:hypothetical protein [Spiroplasma tabanidicola]QGS52111.1 hypothetical protein STABA_v1c07550 [Spiroplasma tabanidicola]